MQSYHKYKEATTLFLNWLEETTDIPTLTVNAILTALEQITSRGITVPTSAYSSLNHSIALRKEAERMHKMPDEKHAYFIEILCYCKAQLFPLLKVPKPKEHSKRAPHPPGGVSNKFGVLTDESSGLDPLDPPQKAPECPKKRKAKVAVWDGSDQLACRFFLLDLDHLMERCVQAWKDYYAKKCSLMEATMISNVCLTQANCLQSQLFLEFPHLSDLPSILITVFLDDVIRYAQNTCSGLSHFDTVAVCTLSWNTLETMKRYNLTQIQVENIKKRVSQNWTKRKSTFFSWSKFLGGDCNFEWIDLYQLFINGRVDPSSPILNRNGALGEVFDRASKKKFENVTHFIMADVLPALCNAVETLPTCKDIREVIMAFYPVLREFIETGKVSAALFFGISIMAWAVSLQGVQNLEGFVDDSVKYFHTLLKQLDKFSPRPYTISKYYVYYTLEVSNNQLGDRQRFYSLLNPFMAGQSLVDSSLLCNVYYGSGDSNPMKTLLHLYNAFRVTHYIKEPIDILEKLMRISINNKGPVWVGGVPTKVGQFMKSYLLSMGVLELSKGSPLKYLKDVKVIPFKPEHLSTFYKRLICKEFEDVKANDFSVYLEELKKSIQGDEVLNLNLQSIHSLVSDTLDCIYEKSRSLWNAVMPVITSRNGKMQNYQQKLYGNDVYMTVNFVIGDCATKEGNYYFFYKFLLYLADLPERSSVIEMAAKGLKEHVMGWKETDYLIEKKMYPGVVISDTDVTKPLGSFWLSYTKKHLAEITKGKTVFHKPIIPLTGEPTF